MLYVCALFISQVSANLVFSYPFFAYNFIRLDGNEIAFYDESHKFIYREGGTHDLLAITRRISFLSLSSYALRCPAQELYIKASFS